MSNPIPTSGRLFCLLLCFIFGYIAYEAFQRGMTPAVLMALVAIPILLLVAQ